MDIDYTKLKSYLKDLSLTERNAFAKRCGTTLNYMNKRISLKKPFGFLISKGIYKESVMRPEELRPIDWQHFQWE